jgi:hypothetical protein
MFPVTPSVTDPTVAVPAMNIPPLTVAFIVRMFDVVTAFDAARFAYVYSLLTA